MARKKLPEVSPDDKVVIGSLLRDLRKAAGYRSADAAAKANPEVSLQTLYAYERGGLMPSLAQFLDLVEFYVLAGPGASDGKSPDDLRAHGVAAIAQVLTVPAYNVKRAYELMALIQPERRTK